MCTHICLGTPSYPPHTHTNTEKELGFRTTPPGLISIQPCISCVTLNACCVTLNASLNFSVPWHLIDGRRGTVAPVYLWWLHHKLSSLLMLPAPRSLFSSVHGLSDTHSSCVCIYSISIHLISFTSDSTSNDYVLQELFSPLIVISEGTTMYQVHT